MPLSPSFADVLLPRAIDKPLTYAVPSHLAGGVMPGSRVIVPLRASKFLTGVVLSVHHDTPSYATKEIAELLDESPVVDVMSQLPFLEWVGKYYMCTAGEVLKAMLPGALNISSDSRVHLHPEFDVHASRLSEAELQTLVAIEQAGDASFYEIAKAVNRKNIHSIIKSLTKKKAVLVYEETKNKYSAKKVTRVCLHASYAEEKFLEQLMGRLGSKHNQLEVLLYYLAEMQKTGGEMSHDFVDKEVFGKQGLSMSALNSLIKNGIFITKDFTVSRFATKPATKPLPELSAEQQLALGSIEKCFETKKVTLLHGVTGSGKTEVYVRLIEKFLSQGKQVLFLLPEIAITTQLVSRLSSFFGEKLGVYHSRYSDMERAEVWYSVRSGKYSVVIGVRSAIFLPFKGLGLVVVDEEHDLSFKQQEAAPRYNARDCAIVLGKIHNAQILLGSATPALETYHAALTDRYGFVELKSRYGDAAMPTVSLVDTKLARREKMLREEFSVKLLGAIEATLENGRQVIIFQNRRGYAVHICCSVCAWVPMCVNCAVNLTYHQLKNRLLCHYCGYKVNTPEYCGLCEAPTLKNVGFGTEKLEESLKSFFPEKNIQRMDLETTRGKYSCERIITAMQNRKIDILVGTQMVVKGLDFGGVSLVGVVMVDKLLHLSDFRANERCFQLMTQVAGRAGRANTKGMAMIQTSDVKNATLLNVVEGDYRGMFDREISERRLYDYPPLVRLIKVSLLHKDFSTLEQMAKLVVRFLRKQHQSKMTISDAIPPVVARVRQMYILDIWVKVSSTAAKQIQVAKDFIANSISDAAAVEKNFKSVRVVLDVDPMS